MRGGRFRSWSALMLVMLLGACGKVIGVSSYKVDPSLDDGGGGGATGTAGKTSHAGGRSTDGGEANESVGGDATGGSGIADATAAGAGGLGSAGESSTGECKTAVDCDDTIDCTTDSCSHGTCLHAPQNTLCDWSRCETCKVGIGCVAGPTTTVQLLADPGFDSLPATDDWDESNSDDVNIVTGEAAQTPTKIARFGPGPAAGADPVRQQYSDLFQSLTIPAGTVALSLSGYYKLSPGSSAPGHDQLQTAIFSLPCPDPNVDPNPDPSCDDTVPLTRFHTFDATTGATTTWKAFAYSSSKTDVARLAGLDCTFDLVAYVWDTVFEVDSLELNATVCQ